ncbi:MAG: mannose-6-phosphate isomerase [Bacteroidetes bacterium]|jgi:mannose-6-phosphate isomerase|nr:MAG: mannose-6-phosphate isomerase [Bacteroidota bacterium]UCE70679.1 MAG: class I mannose-6-phosphate isomerase [Flavobacteriaceae bacterium]
MELYPLKFTPILKERLWGGTRLGTDLDKPVQGDRVGESWELSGVPGDVSVVANGPYRGRTLEELIAAYPKALLGNAVLARFGTDFPILIKFIDAREDLSIQLHPGDELARKRHSSFGKTEMWYIMGADPGSELIIGFNRDVSRKEYQEALDSGRLLELLNYEPVGEGDTFFINSGKIHAIGGGILLAEIQQSSDVTYRVYDFDRRDAGGNLRELHTDMALDAMDYNKRDDFRIDYNRKKNRENTMVDSAYFRTSYLELDTSLTREFHSQESFRAYVCVGGSASLELGTHSVPIQRGETVLVPAAAAGLRIVTGKCRLLEVTL